MKKSKMVQEMTEHWLGKNVHYKEEFIAEVTRDMKSLLNLLEEKGMRPPVETVDPVLFQTKHVWEPEND